MKFKNLGLVLGFHFLLTSFLFAGSDTVQAVVQEPLVSSLYTLTQAGITYEDGNAYIWIEAKAPEEDFPVRRCSDEDRRRSQVHCLYQYGSFLLPQDSVIFDGRKRLKYIRDGHYITIAKLEGVPFFKKWKVYDNVTFSVDEYFEDAGMIVTDPEIGE